MKFGLNKYFAILCLLFTFCNLQESYAQRPNLGTSSRMMNSAKDAMDKEDYDKANNIFRHIIDSNAPIPQEMPYHFAETLFHLKQYDNSSNFLQKYMEINGFNGENYEEARELQTRLEGPLAEIRACQLCDRKGYAYETCSTCEGHAHTPQDCSYCKGKGIVGCSRCAGKGMITKKNVFNLVEYYECDRCNAEGRLTCPECEGSKTELKTCKTCKGSGRVTSDKLCSHEDNQS
ncbi:outer membrane protein assembly factor BamD [Litoribacter populi]|uniref:molecular chaperone DnaJ n=1 Tax=Litoribacter populi TaxID=2598460 RepID=UPI00117C5C69|nr:molecular chaperone DnaJ [Litoribacter populi]